MSFSHTAYENFFEMISNNNLTNNLNNILVITVTDRMCRHLSDNYVNYLSKKNNKKIINSPFVSFSNLKTKLWDLISLDAELNVKVLNQFQQQYIWEGLLYNHEVCSQMLYPNQCLKQLLQAWQYMLQWQGELDFKDWYLHKLVTEQIQIFIDLAKLFRTKCEQENWISSNQVLSEILDNIKNNKIKHNILDKILPNKIFWVGFEKTTPQVNNFIEILGNLGYQSEHIWPLSFLENDMNHKKLRAFECIDPDDEISQILSWVMQDASLYENIGVVIPNLASRRDELINAIEDIKYKQDLVSGFKNDHKSFPLYAITGGKKLSEYRIIQDILDLMYIPITKDKDIFRVLLSSPYLIDSDMNFSIRDKVDWELQQDLNFSHNNSGNIKLWIDFWSDFELKNNKLDEKLDKNIKDILLTNLQDNKSWLADISWRKNNSVNISNISSINIWLERLYKLFEILGWPGNCVLSSDEHQVVAKFYEILQQMPMYEVVASSISYSDFLKLVTEQVSSCLFQPESEQQPKVTFFELLEADTIAFDALWVAGINDDIWPPKAKPNPFIPIIYQKQMQMPHASGERELDFALHIWHRLLQQSPVIMLSCVITDEQGLEKSPSELINAYGLVKADFCDKDSSLINQDYYYIFNNYFKNNLSDLSKISGDNKNLLNNIPDLDPDIISNAQIKELSHGVDIIQHQINCPFKAFARYRLNIKPFRKPSEHLSASDRGQILHEILADFWGEHKSNKNLNNINHDIIENIINKILNSWNIKYPNILFAGILEIEKKRLYDLVIAWLDIEKDRPLFEVSGVEKVIKGEIAGLPILARIDRLDLSKNIKIIVDYKTGLSNKISSWFAQRPSAMQMPLYALLHKDTASIVYALVNKEKLGFQGISDFNTDINGVKIADKKNLSRLCSDMFSSSNFLEDKNININNWSELLSHWQEIANNAVLDFKNSKTVVDPVSSIKTCQYCDYKRLCRI